MDSICNAAEKLKKSEYEKIINSYERLKYTNIDDDYWKLEDDCESLDNLFNEINENYFTKDMQEEFIECMYEKKTGFREEEIEVENEKADSENNDETTDSSLPEAGEDSNSSTSADETSEKTKKVVQVEYEYFAVKNNADRKSAQKILDEYNNNYIISEKFPFYTNAFYVYELKEFWQKEYEEEYFSEENKSVCKDYCSGWIDYSTKKEELENAPKKSAKYII